MGDKIINMDTVANLKARLEKITSSAKAEVATLRTGRITSALVEDIEVDYYDTKTPLKALASFSSPEPRQIVIQPFDKNAVEAIQKAILEGRHSLTGAELARGYPAMIGATLV